MFESVCWGESYIVFRIGQSKMVSWSITYLKSAMETCCVAFVIYISLCLCSFALIHSCCFIPLFEYSLFWKVFLCFWRGLVYAENNYSLYHYSLPFFSFIYLWIIMYSSQIKNSFQSPQMTAMCMHVANIQLHTNHNYAHYFVWPAFT